MSNKKNENSPTEIQTTLDAMPDEDEAGEEGLAIHKPNASLMDHINYGSITRATKQSEAYF